MVRKTKITKTPTVDEALTIEVETQLLATDEPSTQETPPQQTQPQQERPTIQQLLSEAPELYGVSPSANEIEQFKQKESVWRSNLKKLLV